ncbi:flagellar basal body L-ring protein FlgH [Pseudoalteromonas denitrificans]|uniref:Flagellar L-ring protein n=1 Tax=Pseudoalteromonas denitrificans DSM 6059 TaxID=1123010 RepID=A0A1I1HVG9_9GAMM|nr:flagellar basal body L-ring protein FlgH [Pseudoalteromonas denitrificans]SFC24970.1 flagellar L-ring protein precursor FlgH [Pseudoalteromonas denitrificans DSM 6059]
MHSLLKVLKPTVNILLCSTLFGCVSTANRQVVADDPYFTPIAPALEAKDIVATGSLFNEYNANDMYSDRKAVRVGDIITVMLKESTQASKSAKTETDKETDYSLDPIVGLGAKNVNIGGQSIQLGMKSAGSFSGDAKSNQSNSLSGNITVNVMRVLANGNLMIRGEKWLTLNTGEEFIRLEGTVRPTDVSAENTVESTRIANARIQYSGKGDLQESQSPGWLSSFFLSVLSPF